MIGFVLAFGGLLLTTLGGLDSEWHAKRKAFLDTHHEDIFTITGLILRKFQFRVKREDLVNQFVIDWLETNQDPDGIKDLMGYIYTMIYHAGIDLQKQENRWNNQEARLKPLQKPSIENETESLSTEEMDKIWMQISSTVGWTEFQYQVYRMREYENLSYEQIARRLNSTEASVRNVILAAREKLRRKYNEVMDLLEKIGLI